MFNSYDSKKAQQVNEDKAQKAIDGLSGGSSRQRHRLEEGHNVLWVLPSLSRENPNFIAHYNVHFRPLHLCNRAHPVENPNSKSESDAFIEDRNFKNCPRCINTWDAVPKTPEGRLDKSDKEAFKAFKANMPSHQIVVQVVNFTPFFSPPKGRRPTCSVDKERVEKWMKPFVEILRASSLGEDYNVPDDMPTDIAEAAEAGINLLMVSQYSHSGLPAAYFDRYYEDGEVDPLMNPDSVLLQIKKSASGTFGDGPSKRNKYAYDHKFTTFSDWGFPEELDPEKGSVIAELYDAHRIYNIHNITDYDHKGVESLSDKAGSLIQLADEELLELLKDHNYGPERDDEDDVDVSQPQSEDHSLSAADPSSFAPARGILGGRGRRDLSALRDELDD